MEKVRPWCGQTSDRGRQKNKTAYSSGFEFNALVIQVHSRYQNRHLPWTFESEDVGFLCYSSSKNMCLRVHFTDSRAQQTM